MIFSNIAVYDTDTRLPPPDPDGLLLAGPNHNITIDRDEQRNNRNVIQWIEEGLPLDRTAKGGWVGIGTSRKLWYDACKAVGFKRLPDFPVFKWSYRLGGATATLNLNIPTKEQQQ